MVIDFHRNLPSPSQAFHLSWTKKNRFVLSSHPERMIVEPFSVRYYFPWSETEFSPRETEGFFGPAFRYCFHLLNRARSKSVHPDLLCSTAIDRSITFIMIVCLLPWRPPGINRIVSTRKGIGRKFFFMNLFKNSWKENKFNKKINRKKKQMNKTKMVNSTKVSSSALPSSFPTVLHRF